VCVGGGGNKKRSSACTKNPTAMQCSVTITRVAFVPFAHSRETAMLD
jgi:hypothetical protein